MRANTETSRSSAGAGASTTMSIIINYYNMQSRKNLERDFQFHHDDYNLYLNILLQKNWKSLFKFTKKEKKQRKLVVLIF